jgi:hypothetical protein
MKPLDLLKPTWKRVAVALGLAIAIPLLDAVAGFCRGDMCFNGVYRITGQKYYFLGANIMKYTVLALLAYVLLTLLFGLSRWLVSRFRKRP